RSSACALALFLLATLPGLRAVTPLPAGALLQHKAHYFDLQHKRLRFVPRGPAAYDLAVTASRGSIDRGAPIGKPTDPQGYSWRTRLLFPFPFAGKNWDKIYINLNGNLTFGAPETTAYPERDTWPDGTMRWLASAFDTRAIAGERRMI